MGVTRHFLPSPIKGGIRCAIPPYGPIAQRIAPTKAHELAEYARFFAYLPRVIRELHTQLQPKREIGKLDLLGA
jgi:hypothetical protein